jgi:AIPR protein
MHPIITSYLEQFVSEYALQHLPEDQQFERFVNFIVLRQFYAERFDLDAVTTEPPESGIDGAAVLIGDNLVTTADEADKMFMRGGRDLEVKYVFVQAKRSEKFEKTEILNFAATVRDVVSDNPQLPQDGLLKEITVIHQLAVRNVSKIRNGQPDCLLFYVTTGEWQNDPVSAAAILQCKTDLKGTRYFFQVEFEPVDFDGLRKRWLSSRGPVRATFNVAAELTIPEMPDVRQSYLTIISAKEFVEKVLTDETGHMRPRVFDQNVRHFLGDDNNVNNDIRETLQDATRRNRFAILNNGITIVASKVSRMGNTMSVEIFK